MTSKKKAIKESAARKASVCGEKLAQTLVRLSLIDIKGQVDLYFDLRDYWLTKIAIEDRKEWDRLRGR